MCHCYISVKSAKCAPSKKQSSITAVKLQLSLPNDRCLIVKRENNRLSQSLTSPSRVDESIVSSLSPVYVNLKVGGVLQDCIQPFAPCKENPAFLTSLLRLEAARHKKKKGLGFAITDW